MNREHTYAVPVRFDDLANYLALGEPAPFVWVRVASGETRSDATGAALEWAILWHAMRDPDVRGPSRLDPFPCHLAESPDELAAGPLTELERRALLSAYANWCERLGAADLAEIDDDYIERLARATRADSIDAAVMRARYRFARDLAAAYGRPSLSLSQREVFEWLVWTGLYELPASPSEMRAQRGGIVGRFLSYVLRARRDQ
ncbi:MAG: hypothetical protein AAGC55_02375 [Myxococcota bacterium]